MAPHGAFVAQHRQQILSGKRFLVADDLFGRSGRDDRSAAVAAFRTHVDQVVRRLDDVEVVLDHQDRVAGSGPGAARRRAVCGCRRNAARRRLVEHVERAAGRRRGGSVASLTRWASPPDSVVAGCPILM